jgi:hypothetical protein
LVLARSCSPFCTSSNWHSEGLLLTKRKINNRSIPFFGVLILLFPVVCRSLLLVLYWETAALIDPVWLYAGAPALLLVFLLYVWAIQRCSPELDTFSLWSGRVLHKRTLPSEEEYSDP